MTKEQKLYKGLILADLKITESYYGDKDKALRLQAAYHSKGCDSRQLFGPFETVRYGSFEEKLNYYYGH